MQRTDLALEARETVKGSGEVEGVTFQQTWNEKGTVKISTVKILNESGCKKLGKSMGTYVTMEMEEANFSDVETCLAQELYKMAGNIKSCLVVGLGNRDITPDALGPMTVDQILVTRHLEKEFGKKYLQKYGWNNVEAIVPGVMAKTGLEVQEIVQGIVERTKPDVIFSIDALAARSVQRLYKTIQLTDTGISPGAGVGNNRKELSKKTLGVPVIAIGVPTVVDAETIVADYLEEGLIRMEISESEATEFFDTIRNEKMKGMFMAGRDVDQSVGKMSVILSKGLNRYLGTVKIKE